MDFKKNSFENRFDTANKLLTDYPDRIPVIVISDFITKDKFLVPQLTVSGFMREICKYSKLNGNEGIFMFVNDSIPTPNDLMHNVYKNHKDKDGFLYVNFRKENSFG
jgi:GABA(A) receptor-associated protein